MENFDEDIENEYRKRFDNFEEMPDDALWKNIQALIKPEEKRPLVIWWNTLRGPVGMAASVLIGLLIGAYFLIRVDSVNQTSDLPEKADTSASQTVKPGQGVESKPVQPKADSKAGLVIRDKTGQVATLKSKKDHTTGRITEPAHASTDSQLAGNNEKHNGIKAVVPAIERAENAEENKTAVAVIAPNPTASTDKQVSTEIKQSEEDKTQLASNAIEKAKEETKTITEEKVIDTGLASSQSPDQPISASAVTADEKAQALILKDTLFQHVNALSGKETQSLAVKEKKLIVPELPVTEAPVIEEEEKRRLVFIPPTEIFANVTSTLSYYMFAPNKGDNIMVNNFSSNSQRLGFAAQLGFVYPIAKKMDLRTGLSYFSGKSRISYGITDDSERTVTVLNDNAVQINPGNSTKNESRNWQYFELQSDVLYEVRKMQALSLGMKFGVQTSAINKPLLQARIGYRLSKAIAQHWALWLEPTVSVSLSSQHSLENLFMYRTTGLGLNMGVSLLR